LKKNIVLAVLVGFAALALRPSFAGPKDKKTAQVVDAGAFDIYVNGKRVGTETFHIEQRTDVSVASSEIKVEDGANKADQTSEMQVGPDGALKLYTWRSMSPQKEESILEPKDQFLVEHLTSADQKKRDLPYVLPPSTVILDDNFFSQREVLVWRYLAQGCIIKDGARSCGPGHFGTLVPRQHAPGHAVMEIVGRDKITVKGVEREMNKLKLDNDGVQWLLWVEDSYPYKVDRITVPGENIEIVRE